MYRQFSVFTTGVGLAHHYSSDYTAHYACMIICYMCCTYYGISLVLIYVLHALSIVSGVVQPCA